MKFYFSTNLCFCDIYFEALNHFGTAPVDVPFEVFDWRKFWGIRGFFDEQLASLVDAPSLLTDAKTRDAPEPVDSFSNTSGFKYSPGMSQPKCKRADGTQFDSMSVSLGSKIVFGGVMTEKNPSNTMKRIQNKLGFAEIRRPPLPILENILFFTLFLRFLKLFLTVLIDYV